MEGGAQQICRYFRAGNCKYGSQCKFSHQQPSHGNGSSQTARQPTPEDVIVNDLSKKPIWELSCYGLNVSWETGRNILNSDVSPEELRLEAYAQNIMLGNINAYLETLARTRAERSLTIKRILDDPSSAVQIARAPLVASVPVLASSQSLSSDQIALQVPQHALNPAVNQAGNLAVNPAANQVSLQVPQHVQAPQQQPRPAFQFGQIPDLPPS